MSVSIVALETYLGPLKPFLDEEGVTEISMNQPGEAWVEKNGEMIRHTVPKLDMVRMLDLANLIAAYTNQKISDAQPLLSATIPGGYRIQIVLPPAVERDFVALSIRKQTILNLTLRDYAKLGAFKNTNKKSKREEENEKELIKLYESENYEGFIEKAILAKKNILIAAGTSTGKTVFLNTALRAVPLSERIITIEDVREVHIPHPNRVHLICSKGDQGLAKGVIPEKLLEATLRLRPDRIILGELRGDEAFAYLRAINSGHPGSITSIHADCPEMAFEQLVLMVIQSGLPLTREQIKQYAESIIPIVVQLKREGKERNVTEIYYNKVKR